MEKRYGDNYIHFEDDANTTKSAYLKHMTAKGSEFVYQWIHSYPQALYFADSFQPNEDNILLLSELENHAVYGSFFNLYNCSASRYTEEDGNLATYYLHSQKGLATIGSTKTGGMHSSQLFHTALLSTTWGEAFKLWIEAAYNEPEKADTTLSYTQT